MNFKKMFRKENSVLFFFAFIAGAVLMIGGSVWATTIGDNVSVTGTFTSTGAATLSSTVAVTGAATFNGNVTLGDAAADIILSTGILNASSTLAVTGVSNFYSNVNVNGFATTTASNGNFATEGTIYASSTIGVSTSTPAQELGVLGDAFFQTPGNGTTTINLSTAATGVGSCINMRGTNGTLFRIYATATTSSYGRLVIETGSCLTQ